MRARIDDDLLDELAATLVPRLSALADRHQDMLDRKAKLERSLRRLAEQAEPLYLELRAIENGTWTPDLKHRPAT